MSTSMFFHLPIQSAESCYYLIAVTHVKWQHECHRPPHWASSAFSASPFSGLRQLMMMSYPPAANFLAQASPIPLVATGDKCDFSFHIVFIVACWLLSNILLCQSLYGLINPICLSLARSRCALPLPRSPSLVMMRIYAKIPDFIQALYVKRLLEGSYHQDIVAVV